MTIGLNNLFNNWFNSKTVDTNSDGKISKDELSIFANKVAQKPQSERSSEDLLADTLLNSSKSGQSFFDLASAFDGESGLSKQDLTTFASPAGKKDEITFNDFIAVGQTQTIDQKADTKETPQEPQTTNYEIKKGDTLWAISQKLKKENANYANKSVPEIIKSLQEANDIKDANKIYAGETLKILANPETKTAAADTKQSNSSTADTTKTANTATSDTEQANTTDTSSTTTATTTIKNTTQGKLPVVPELQDKMNQISVKSPDGGLEANTNEEETDSTKTFNPIKIQNQPAVFNPSMTQNEALNNVGNSTAAYARNSKQVFDFIMSQPVKPVKKKSKNTNNNAAANTDNQNANTGSKANLRQVGYSRTGLADFITRSQKEFGLEPTN